MDFGGGDEIRFERVGKAGVVTLSRPKALNSLTHGMVRALFRALEAWRSDPEIAVVLVKGEGRAFCAGGDILKVYEDGLKGTRDVEFFADEYRLNAAIPRFPKPYVALLNGITMGGGVGVSAHGSHRVVTENAIVAMPEVGIGFFPDVGGSHFLPRLRGSYGLYMALTGNRVRQGDALATGLATHAVASSDLDSITGEICETGDPDAILENYRRNPSPETPEDRMAAIRQFFSGDSLDDMLSALSDARSQAFADEWLRTIGTRSPTSLKVAFRALRLGASMSMDECMRMEFRIVNRMLANRDFYEGIRAAIIDKGSAPEWSPATLEEVEDSMIDAYFAPLSGGELAL